MGDEYSFSYAAANRLSSGAYRAYDRLSKVISAVGNECEYAVVPVENNIEGAVNEVYDALFDAELFIVSELVLPVKHCLVAERGMTLDRIKRVASHPQAIGQCHRFLSGLDVEVEAVSSTSKALGVAVGTTAAIAIGPRDGQEILCAGIADSPLNATRFAVLGKAPVESGGTASVMFDLKNEAGALLRALDVFYRRDVNMSRILSRPSRKGDGKYRFSVDFDCLLSGDGLTEFLAKLGEHCVELKFLGRYDCETVEDIQIRAQSAR